MSRRLNWKKRFRSGAVSTGYRYDERLHQDMVNPKLLGVSKQQLRFNIAKTHGFNHKQRVSMPEFSFSQKKQVSTRVAAEQRMVERITEAVTAIEYSLDELLHIPNPSTTFRNRVHQRELINVLAKLRNCVYPPIQLKRFDSTPVQQKQRVKMDLDEVPMCVSCGGPARFEIKSGWFCEDCRPETAQ